MRIWHWQALKNVRLNQQKRNPPYYCDNCFTTLLGLILATNSLFNTSPSSLDLVVEIACWSKNLLTLKDFHWNYWPELDLISHEVGMALPLRWWPGHFSLKKLQELWILPYATLSWSSQDDASHILHAVLLNTLSFKINAKSNLVRRLDNLDPAGRKRLCEENFCWRFLVHVLLRVRHRFHLNLLKYRHVIAFLRHKVCHWSNSTHLIQLILIGIGSTIHAWII